MGNGCFCCNSSYKPDIQLDSLGENITKPIMNNNINGLSKYFTESGKEINDKEKKEKSKRKSNIDRNNIIKINTMDHTKYELMLKRLLEQKEKDRNGPKRRITIRIRENNEDFKKLIQEVIQEKGKNNNNQVNKNNQNKKMGSLLLNCNEKNKLAFRSTVILSGAQIITNNIKNSVVVDINNFSNNLVNKNKNWDEKSDIKVI